VKNWREMGYGEEVRTAEMLEVGDTYYGETITKIESFPGSHWLHITTDAVDATGEAFQRVDAIEEWQEARP
jgi:hypothetical protein